MGKSKFRRCTATGCRTLTANELCAVHATPAAPIAAAPVKPWQRVPTEADDALLDEIDAEIAAERALQTQRVAERAEALARRADLQALADGMAKTMRRHEQPTFADEGRDHG